MFYIPTDMPCFISWMIALTELTDGQQTQQNTTWKNKLITEKLKFRFKGHHENMPI